MSDWLPHRFSLMVAVSVIRLAVTGIILMAPIGGVSPSMTLPHGVALLVKLVAFMLMLVWAGGAHATLRGPSAGCVGRTSG